MAEKQDHHVMPASGYGGVPSRDHPNPSDMFSGKFPRVLVFDQDPEYKHILETHLQEFQYKVTSTHDEERAMYLLRNHNDKFDIAIVEAQNSDGDRFRLISEIASEIDHLPIIIISKDDSVESVKNWMMAGACDYLIKPVRPEDLRLIFKHTVKKMQLRKSMPVAGEEDEKATQKLSPVEDPTIINTNKRKRAGNFTNKKGRVVWNKELHQKFLIAVEHLTQFNDVVPKRILEVMNVEGITRENVASHLQKYRMNQEKKLNDQNKRGKRNRTFATPQEGGMYNGEGPSEVYIGRDLQFHTHHHINNIPQQSSSMQHQSTNPYFMSHSPLGYHHHHDGVSVSDVKLEMTHQHHHHPHPQTSEFPIIASAENVVYNEDEDEAGMINMNFWLEEMSLRNLEEPFDQWRPTRLPFREHQLAARRDI